MLICWLTVRVRRAWQAARFETPREIDARRFGPAAETTHDGYSNSYISQNRHVFSPGASRSVAAHPCNLCRCLQGAHPQAATQGWALISGVRLTSISTRIEAPNTNIFSCPVGESLSFACLPLRVETSMTDRYPKCHFFHPSQVSVCVIQPHASFSRVLRRETE